LFGLKNLFEASKSDRPKLLKCKLLNAKSKKKDMTMRFLYNLNIVLLISNIKSCIDGEHKKNRKN